MSSPPFNSNAAMSDRSRYRPLSQGFSFTPRQDGPVPATDPQRSRPAGVGISFSFQPGSSSARVSAVSQHVQAIRSDPRGLTVAPGDTLIGVNGRDVSGFPPVLLREELLGPAGSKVLLRFERVQETVHGQTTVQFEIVAERGFVGQKDSQEPAPPPVTRLPPFPDRDRETELSLKAQREDLDSRLAQARAEAEGARRAQAIAEEGEAKMAAEVKRLSTLLEQAERGQEELRGTQTTRGEEVRALQMSLLAAQEDVNDQRERVEWLEGELGKARALCEAAQHKEAKMLAVREEERVRRSENASEVAILEAGRAEVQAELSKARQRTREEEVRREEAEARAEELQRRLLASESQREELEGQLWLVEEGSGREALSGAKLRSEALQLRERADDLELELQDALEQREAAEAAQESSRRREEKAVKALEEVRAKAGEQARGREAAEREREGLEGELRRATRAYHQLRDKLGGVEVSRAQMQAEKVALAVRVRDLEEELTAERKAREGRQPQGGERRGERRGEEGAQGGSGGGEFRLFDSEVEAEGGGAGLREHERGGERGHASAERKESPAQGARRERGRGREGRGAAAGSPEGEAGAGSPRQGRSVRWSSGSPSESRSDSRTFTKREASVDPGPRGPEGSLRGSQLGMGASQDRGWGKLMAGENSGWDGWKVTAGELRVTRPPPPEDEAEEEAPTVEAQQVAEVGVGINVEHTDGGGLRVSEVVEGMSGHLSGAIGVGDEVVEVDGRPVQGLSIEEVARRVKGKEGTPVQLTLRTVKRAHGIAKAASSGHEGSKNVARDWEVTLLRGAWDYVDYFDKGAAAFPLSPRTKRSPQHRL